VVPQEYGLQKQSVLYREATPGGRPALVLDPNALSPDGSIAVAQWSVSADGRTLGYTTAVAESDPTTSTCVTSPTGASSPNVVARVKFSGISWTRDGHGFYYSRFRGSAERANLREANTHHSCSTTRWAADRSGWSSNARMTRPPA